MGCSGTLITAPPASTAGLSPPAPGPARHEWVLVHRRGVELADSDSDATPPPPVNNAGFVSEGHAVAVCYPADILVTDNGGQSWRRPVRPLINGALSALEFFDDKMVWAGGGNSLLASADGGETWRELPHYGSIYSSGDAFSFISPTVGWYAQGVTHGTAPALAITRDAGSNWTPVSLPPAADGQVMAVSLVSERLGFVLLTAGTILRTTDGGENWDPITLPLLGRSPVHENLGAPIEALRFEDLRRGTAVLYFAKPRGFVVFDTVDGGCSWHEQQLPAEGRPTLGNVYLSRDGRLLTITDLDSRDVILYRRP